LPDSLLVSNFLDQFGRAERGQPCACERTADASVGQALHVSNGQTLNDKLRHESSIVSAWLRDNRTDDQIVQQVFLMALARRPTDAERKPYLAALNGAKSPAERREVLEDMLWAVLTGREFLFNH
jgi:hypothetical protein